MRDLESRLGIRLDSEVVIALSFQSRNQTFRVLSIDGSPLSIANLVVFRETFNRFRRDRKSTRLNSSHVRISYAVFCLKKKKHNNNRDHQRYQIRNHKSPTQKQH